MDKIKHYILIISLLTTFLAKGQVSTDTIKFGYNGIKDGNEQGVDCGNGLRECNGTVDLIFNAKSYKTGIVQVSNKSVKIERRNKLENSIIFLMTFYTGEPTSGFTLVLGPFSYDKMTIQKFNINALSKKNIALASTNNPHPSATFLFHKTDTQVLLSKVEKKTYFEITEVDNVERIISGKFIIVGETEDGSPVDINGLFTGISY